MIEKKSKSIDWYSRKIVKGTRVGILRHHKYLISLDSFQTFNKFSINPEIFFIVKKNQALQN